MFLASVVLLMASSLVPCLTVAQPHIVVIMADDLGWNDVGFHGSDQIPTPNIDALAYHGVILNRHYTMPTCTPSRTAFLTGKHPIRTGMQGFPLRAGEPRGIPLEERLLPERLAQLGYSTHLVGKWHVGAHRVDYTPTRRGFASHFGYWNGYIGYFDHNIQQGEFRGLDLHRDLNPTPENRGQYATDVFTREAVDIILSHDKSRPLYLQVAHLAVHSGNDTLQLEVPDVDATERRFSYITNPRRRLFAGMLARLDESVGKIVEAMAERGMLDNSILVFLSDNGAQTFGLHTNEGSNWPLRGLKFTLFEGGVRGTCAIWSPLIQQTGRVSSDLIHISDWLPTLYSAAGGNVSDLGDVDGVDQWPNLAGIPGDSSRSELLLNIDSSRGMEALISGEWKLVVGSFEEGVYDYHYGDDGWGMRNHAYSTEVLQSPVSRCIAAVFNGSSAVDEADIGRLRSLAGVECRGVIVNGSGPYCNSPCLFKLTDDPCETNDVSSVYPELVERMKKTLDGYRERMVPQLNQPVDPDSDPALYDDVWVPWLDFSTNSCGIQGGTFLVSFIFLWMVTRSFLV